MANVEQKKYPQAYLAQGNGDFVSATDFSIKTTNNAKQIHTLREKGSGFTLGTEESNVSFNLVVSERGPEREFHRQLKEGEAVQIRAKIPGGSVLTLNGVYNSIDISASLDDAVKYAIGFVGHMERPS